MRDYIKYLYWKIRMKHCGIINFHVTLKPDMSWSDLTFSQKADIYKMAVMSANGKPQGKDITNEVL